MVLPYSLLLQIQFQTSQDSTAFLFSLTNKFDKEIVFWNTPYSGMLRLCAPPHSMRTTTRPAHHRHVSNEHELTALRTLILVWGSFWMVLVWCVFFILQVDVIIAPDDDDDDDDFMTAHLNYKVFSLCPSPRQWRCTAFSFHLYRMMMVMPPCVVSPRSWLFASRLGVRTKQKCFVGACAVRVCIGLT